MGVDNVVRADVDGVDDEFDAPVEMDAVLLPLEVSSGSDGDGDRLEKYIPVQHLITLPPFFFPTEIEMQVK